MSNPSVVYNLPEQRGMLAERFKAHKTVFDRKVLSGVLSIFDEVADQGDAAIKSLTERFDGVKLNRLVLPDDYPNRCIAALSPALRSAIDQVIRNVHEVNIALLPQTWEKRIRPGTVIGERVVPLDSVGIWIPARKGPLLSTAIMLVTAAKAAGVRRIVVGMPPLANADADGLGDPGTVAAAKLAGADQFVVGNGVAVIAAFAQGTESVAEVDGIYGPGPGGIAAAMSVAMTYGKRSALGLGPTECAILADETADPVKTAYDLINEAEHGPDSSSILVTTSAGFARQVEAQLWTCIEEADERRKPYLQTVFSPEGKGVVVVAPDLDAACTFVNEFAPEHLMVVCSQEEESRVLARITHAGEILIGSHTPFSAANYGIGITAVLPTNQFAKAFSGVTSKDMVKCSTIGKLDKEALQDIYPIIQELGSYEQLPGHVKAADIRLRD